MTDAREYLKAKHGWPDLAARAVAETLLANPHETWRGIRQQRMHDWCSAMEKDKNSITAQCDFMDYELSNSLAALGAELNTASTKEEANDTARKYLLVGNPTRFLTQQEAEATGYSDAGNSKLVGDRINKASNIDRFGASEKVQETAPDLRQAEELSAGSANEHSESACDLAKSYSQHTALPTNQSSKLG